jgi:hypothetical protein
MRETQQQMHNSHEQEETNEYWQGMIKSKCYASYIPKAKVPLASRTKGQMRYNLMRCRIFLHLERQLASWRKISNALKIIRYRWVSRIRHQSSRPGIKHPAFQTSWNPG